MRELHALCLLDLGQYYYELRKYKEARNHYLKALEISALWEGEVGEALNALCHTRCNQCEVRQLAGRFNVQSSNPLEQRFETIEGLLSKYNDDHPWRGLYRQAKAHYCLESWKLTEVQNLLAPLKKESVISFEYYQCQMLLALAAHYSGDLHRTEITLSEAIVELDELRKKEELLKDEKLQTLLVNFYSRQADFYFFLRAGSLNESRDSLVKGCDQAELIGLDDKKNKYHYLYRRLKARLELLDILTSFEIGEKKGNLLLRDDTYNPLTEKDREVKLYKEVIYVFQKYPNDFKALHKVFYENYDGINVNSFQRDVRQLLLFLCEYLLNYINKNEFSEQNFQSERLHIQTIRTKLTEPWNKKDGVQSKIYLEELGESARNVYMLIHK